MSNTLSVCMIVKDEEEVLGACLESVKDWADEIIVVDTGSTDKTVEIAESFGAKIFKQEWQNDFSFHRNYAMEQATTEWILTLDADERVPKGDGGTLKGILAGTECDVVAVDLLNVYGDPPVIKGRTPQIRVFRRSYDPKYTGKVHNRPVVKKDSVIFRVPFRIVHIGYDLPPEKMDEKFQRTVSMCRRLTKDEPDDPTSWFHLARALKAKNGQINVDAKDEITNALNTGIDLCNGENDGQNIYIQLLAFMAQMKYFFGEYVSAIHYATKALAFKPDYLDAIFFIGMSYTYGVDASKAEPWLTRYLYEQAAYQFSDKMDSISMEYANARGEVYRALADVEEWKAKQLS